MKGEANRLIDESSPYLLQHAYNPVDWRAWNEESLKAAKEEDKPILVSIGYSACHWCHVMEKESFENDSVAKLMNEHFICIKVDREERPDIDHLYMDATQMMTGRGGWPLNCFTLPDGRPFFGGTYFPKDQWIKVLNQLIDVYQNDREKVEEYAEKLSQGLEEQSVIEVEPVPERFVADELIGAIRKWKQNIDKTNGGNNYAPKFPMPTNYQFLLNYLHFYPDKELEEHLKLSLEKMAMGGIYDQIGGGFARYSTDMLWKVPHFEKMLYDNAQLVALYSEAYKKYRDPLYAKVIQQTIEFMEREMMDETFAFYSALDADSEGEEGKFYVWDKTELKALLKQDEYEFIKDYYHINQKGEWEGNYILLRTERNEDFAKRVGLSVAEVEEKVKNLDDKLMDHRSKRIRPGLDDKSLTSWNALTIIGLSEAFEALGDPHYLELAQACGKFIQRQQRKEDGGLYRNYKDGKSNINGFLEDYAFTILAFVRLYENTFESKWLQEAESLAAYTIAHFYEEKSGYFYFNSDEDPSLVVRKIEKSDNVIPSSNSAICRALFELGNLLYNQEYLRISDQMLSNSETMINEQPSYASNWGIQLLNRSHKYFEVAVLGLQAQEQKKKLHSHYLPNCLFLGSTDEQTKLALLENKWVDGQNTFYVCLNQMCKEPTTDATKALEQLFKE